MLGTRPEAIKLGPVLRMLATRTDVATTTVVTGQQPDLLADFLATFSIQPSRTLRVMKPGQSVGALLSALLHELTPALRELAPHAVLVQGDTTTALAGALVGAYARIPVIHVEAGLRTNDLASPWPEEINRLLITHAASLHCAATAGNVANLRREGVPEQAIVLTGNPIVDAVSAELPRARPSAALSALLAATTDRRRVVLTAHRRENFGLRLAGYLDALATFVAACPHVEVMALVHPNPDVERALREHLQAHARVHLLAPLGYHDFLCLLRSADLVLSDSGGVQEEIAVIGTPLFILREKTERPEILTTGRARLAPTPAQLARLLSAIGESGEWPGREALPHNPFGDGHSGARIAAAIAAFLST